MNQQINLYLPEFRPETNAFQSMFIVQAAGMLVVALLLLYGYAWQGLSGIDRELAVVQRQEVAALERLQNVRPLIMALTGEQSWSEQLEQATRMLAEREAALRLIRGTALGVTHGFSGHLRALARQDIDGIWLTHIVLSAAGDRTRIEGRAIRPELIPLYVQDLTSEPAFSAQRFHRFQIDSIEDDGEPGLRFSMDSEMLAARAAQ